MADFATSAELAGYLGIAAIPADRATQAARVLADASAAIRAWTRQTVSVVTDENVILDPPRGPCLVLPQAPVITLTSITVAGTLLVVNVDYVADLPNGLVYRPNDLAWTSCFWPNVVARQSIVVVYTHGHATIPDAVKGVCLALAARQYENPLSARSEGLGALQRAFQGEPGDLTEGEKESLQPYAHGRN